MATHSSVLAWRIPGMGQPGGMGSHRVGHNCSDLAAAAATTKMGRRAEKRYCAQGQVTQVMVRSWGLNLVVQFRFPL